MKSTYAVKTLIAFSIAVALLLAERLNAGTIPAKGDFSLSSTKSTGTEIDAKRACCLGNHCFPISGRSGSRHVNANCTVHSFPALVRQFETGLWADEIYISLKFTIPASKLIDQSPLELLDPPRLASGYC
jgi:hypothetical protein